MVNMVLGSSRIVNRNTLPSRRQWRQVDKQDDFAEEHKGLKIDGSVKKGRSTVESAMNF